MTAHEDSAFHGVDFKARWCEGYGMPCDSAADCCGNHRKIRAVAYDHAVDVEGGLLAEVERLERDRDLGAERCAVQMEEVAQLREILRDLDHLLSSPGSMTMSEVCAEGVRLIRGGGS